MNIKYPRDSKILHPKNTKKTNKIDAENYKKTTEMQLNLDELQTKVNGLNQTVDAVSQSTQNFDDALAQISTNTSGISALSQSVTTLQSTVGANSQNITALQTAVGTNTQNISTLQSTKQNVLTAGTNITIQNNTISATDTIYTAGNNITIDANNQISATDTTYTAGTGISISNGVISATGGGGLSSVTADDVDSELATQGQVLTADGQGGATWQTASGGNIDDKINQIKNILKTAELYDENALNNQFTPYPNGTIVKTYDCYERQLDITYDANNEILPPNVFCTTEIGNTATITFNFSCWQKTSGVFTYNFYDNDTLIDTYNRTTQGYESNDYYIHSYTINNYQLTTKNHNFYCVITTSSQNMQAKLGNIKVEITAPNIVILNKIQPFDVEYNYYTDTYYLSDCSTGFAKICEIPAGQLSNTKDISWTNTGIEAQNYRYFFTPANNNVKTATIKNAIVTKKDMTIDIVSENGNSYTFPFGTAKVTPWSQNTNIIKLFVQTISKNTIQTATTQLSNFSTVSKTYYSYNSSITNLESIKQHWDYCSETANKSPFLCTFRDGDLKFALNSNNNYSLSFATDLFKAYMTQYSTYNYYCDVFCNHYGKFIKIVMHWQTNSFETLERTEIGTYQDYFKGANNDYFCVVDGKLHYYKY